jgi:hypothetical protein
MINANLSDYRNLSNYGRLNIAEIEDAITKLKPNIKFE